MRYLSVVFVLASLVLAACEPHAETRATETVSATSMGGAVIDVDDVYLFYNVYDSADGRPTADQIQLEYLDAGSDGLRIFMDARNTTADHIADAIAARPELFSEARACLDVLPNVKDRLEAALAELGRLYPEAAFPPVTIAVGRGRPVGIGSPVRGIQIGLEALCATEFLNPDVEDRFVHVIAHEYAHVQQPEGLTDGEDPTVLEISLMEGAAEFIAELTSGHIAYAYFDSLVAGREYEIESAFAEDRHETDLSDWVYNTTADELGDLGYWVGYRIAKSYYHHAEDEGEAVRQILGWTDAEAFFQASGWEPGIELGPLE